MRKKNRSRRRRGVTKVHAVRWLFIARMTPKRFARRAPPSGCRHLPPLRRRRVANCYVWSFRSPAQRGEMPEGRKGALLISAEEIRSWMFIPHQQRAPLGQNSIDRRIQIVQGLIDRHAAANHAIGHQLHLVGDAFPLRHFRRRLDQFELFAKRARILVVRQFRIIPRAAPRGQVAGQLIEPILLLDRGQEFRQLPCQLFVFRTAENGKARTAGRATAGTVDARQRRRAPAAEQAAARGA